jgi:hypothetical protein
VLDDRRVVTEGTHTIDIVHVGERSLALRNRSLCGRSAHLVTMLSEAGAGTDCGELRKGSSGER